MDGNDCVIGRRAALRWPANRIVTAHVSVSVAAAMSWKDAIVEQRVEGLADLVRHGYFLINPVS